MTSQNTLDKPREISPPKLGHGPDTGRLDGTERPILSIMEKTCAKGVRKMPVLPEKIDAALATKVFTNGKEDRPLCSRTLLNAFERFLFLSLMESVPGCFLLSTAA